MKLNLTETGIKCHKNDEVFSARAGRTPSALVFKVPSLQNGQMC